MSMGTGPEREPENGLPPRAESPQQQQAPKTDKLTSTLQGASTILVPGERAAALIAPGVTIPSNDDFFQIAEPGFVAIDGLVGDTTDFDFLSEDAPRGNINHHQGADAKSCSKQMYELIRTGGIRQFLDDDGALNMTICMNHADGDTITVFALAESHTLLDGTNVSESIRRWVEYEDHLDTHCGCYPIDLTSQTAKVMSHILNGYMIGRAQPGATNMINMANNFRSAVTALSNYFSGTLPGELEPVKKKFVHLNTLEQYEQLVVPDGLNVVTQEELFARVVLTKRAAERDRFISLIREPNGEETERGYQYVLGKLTPYGPHSMELRKNVLNIAEKLLGVQINEMNKWAGNSMVFGSPRGTGSLLNPFQLTAIEDAIHQLEHSGARFPEDPRIQQFLTSGLPKILEAY
jgi:hypothetical protein